MNENGGVCRGTASRGCTAHLSRGQTQTQPRIMATIDRGTIGDDDVDVTRATFRGVNTKIIFFCFFYFLHQSQQQTQQRQAGHRVVRLEGTALRDSDSRLGGAGRGAEGLDLLDEIHAVDNLACSGY